MSFVSERSGGSEYERTYEKEFQVSTSFYSISAERPSEYIIGTQSVLLPSNFLQLESQNG